jgi:hypothetical protein
MNWRIKSTATGDVYVCGTKERGATVWFWSYPGVEPLYRAQVHLPGRRLRTFRKGRPLQDARKMAERVLSEVTE